MTTSKHIQHLAHQRKQFICKMSGLCTCWVMVGVCSTWHVSRRNTLSARSQAAPSPSERAGMRSARDRGATERLPPWNAIHAIFDLATHGPCPDIGVGFAGRRACAQAFCTVTTQACMCSTWCMIHGMCVQDLRPLHAKLSSVHSLIHVLKYAKWCVFLLIIA